MNTFFSHVKNFVENEEGAIAIEYALLAALIGIALIITVVAMRKQICGVFTAITTALLNNASATGATPACAA